MAQRPFRFGVTAAGARSGVEWIEKARRVESLGYTTLVVPDNLQHTLAPFPALAVAATATTTLRVGTLRARQRLPQPSATGEGGGDARPTHGRAV